MGDTPPPRTLPATRADSSPARDFIIRNDLVVATIRVPWVKASYAEDKDHAFTKINRVPPVRHRCYQ